MKRIIALAAALMFLSSQVSADSLGSAAGGQAANQSSLGGCKYDSVLPALAASQQVAIHCNNRGEQLQAFSNPIFITKTISFATGYTAGQNIAGLLTITGLTPNQTYRLANMTMPVAGTLTATSSIIVYIFNANPTASTFTDGNSAVLNTADTAKVVRFLSGNITSAGGVGGYAFVVQTISPAITADSNGQIYIGLVAGGTFTLTNPIASLYLEFDN